jgi:hypothetical protein
MSGDFSLLVEGRHLLSSHGSPFRAHLRLWTVKTERRLSPEGTLKTASWGAANGTQRTLGELLWVSANDPFETPNHCSSAWLGVQFEVNRDGILERSHILTPVTFA